MDENEIIGFSWSIFFAVTSICGFLFTGVIWLLDGNISLIFLSLAIGTLLLSVINGTIRYMKNN